MMPKAKTYKPTIQEIDQAIDDGYKAMRSIAERVGTTVRMLTKILYENNAGWKVPRDAIDIHLVRYYVDQGIIDPVRIGSTLRTKYCKPQTADIAKLVDEIQAEQREIEKQARKKSSKIRSVRSGWPCNRESISKTPEMLRCEMKRNERLDAQFAASISAG
jgi:hypothetical protein